MSNNRKAKSTAIRFKNIRVLFGIAALFCTLRTEATVVAPPPDARFCATLFTPIWFQPNKPIDGDGPTTYSAWSRARATVETTDSQTLEKIFSSISKADLDQLFWGIKQGRFRASAREEEMISQVWYMVNELGPSPFWGRTTNRGAAIRRALIEFDQAPERAEAAIEKADIEILSRAISERFRNVHYDNTRFFDRASRFVFPTYPQVRTILAASNTLRFRLQAIAHYERPVREVLKRYGRTGHFSEAELVEIMELNRSISERRRKVQSDIERLYGRAVSNTNPLRAEDARIPDLARRAGFIDLTRLDSSLQQAAERNLDILERILKMPISEKTDTHLQIRNRQFRRETRRKLANYLSTTWRHFPEKAVYRVRTEWTVTVKHEGHKDRSWVRDIPAPDGQVVRTETYHDNRVNRFESHYPMARNDVLQMTYEEILQNSVAPSIERLPSLGRAKLKGPDAVSAFNGTPNITILNHTETNAILARAQAVRKVEGGFRELISESIHFLNGITNASYKTALQSPTGLAALRASLLQYQGRLVLSRDELVKYQALDSASIRRQWSGDRESDFRDRNAALVDLYDHTILRIAHIIEQVNRATSSIVFEYTPVDYEPQLTLLRDGENKGRSLIRNSAIAMTAVAGLTLGSYFIEPSFQEALIALSSSFGP